MDSICGEEVKLISYLQTAFGRWEKQMLFLSRLGDPRNSFLIYFPAVFHVDSSLGLNVLWSAILSEWCNLILKWVLRGDRPYWWIHETDKQLNINLTQFELTCETGPGAPSGHVMVTASVWFLMIAFLVTQLNSIFSASQQHQCQLLLVAFSWAVFVSVLVLVSVSRVFIATHFPHQVLLGAVVGVSLAHAVKRSRHFGRLTNLLQCCVVSLILIVSSLICYYLLSMALHDPSLSLRKAQRWCLDPSYIHLDTTPFYALVRDAGAACGIGVAYLMVSVCGLAKPLSLQSRPIGKPIALGTAAATEDFLNRCVKILLSIFGLQVLETIVLPSSHILVFYVAGYVKNVFLPITVIFLVPYICRFVSNHCTKLFSWHAKQQ